MHGINTMNDAMGEVMIEYNNYTKKCEKEGKEPLGFFKFFVGLFKGTLNY